MREFGVIAGATMGAWSSYLRESALRGPLGLSPLAFAEDATRFSQALVSRRPARFHRDSEVIAEWPLARLRDFSPAASRPGARPPVPTLVVPPSSGHTSVVVDLSARDSLLGTALSAGLMNLHCIEWLEGGPDSAEADTGIEGHLRVLADAVVALGGRANVIGFSQGGWLATIFAAQAPDAVVTLTVAAAPVDCHRGRPGALVALARLASTRLGAIAGGALPWAHLPSGAMQLMGLQAAEWPWVYERLAALWGGIGDDATVSAEAALQDWLQQPQDVPAQFYRWSVEHLFIRNELARGVLLVAGERVDLAAIRCPLFLIAGLRDTIVVAEQLWALAELVSTPAADVVKVGVDCGHLGLIADAEVLRGRWLPMLREVRRVSDS